MKTTNELLLIRSDLYGLTPDCEVESLIEHAEPFIDLGPAYRHVAGFEERFPHGVPSIRACSSLRVEADATFGAGVVCTGDVRVTGGVRTIADGAHLEGGGVMRTVAEHRDAVLAARRAVAGGAGAGRGALGLVLAQDVTAVVDLPGFDNSAMDGYAVRAAELAGATREHPVVLPVTGDIAAGDTTRHVAAGRPHHADHDRRPAARGHRRGRARRG